MAAMNEAAAFLVGTHDYQSFASARDTRDNAVRTITDVHAETSPDGDEIIVSVTANRFLYHMVRNIVGTLAEIGRGRWPAEKMAHILAARDRTQAGPTAPAQGLSLIHVEYPKIFISPLDTAPIFGNTLES